MFGLIIPSWLKNALTCAVVAIAAYGAGYVHGGIASRSEAEIDRLGTNLEALQDRNKNDAESDQMDGYSLCVSIHGRVPECDKFR